jgi:hypothetical protein
MTITTSFFLVPFFSFCSYYPPANTAWCNQPLQHGLIAIPPLSLDSNPVTRYLCFQRAFSFMALAILGLPIPRSSHLFEPTATLTTATIIPHAHYCNGPLYLLVLLHRKSHSYAFLRLPSHVITTLHTSP